MLCKNKYIKRAINQAKSCKVFFLVYFLIIFFVPLARVNAITLDSTGYSLNSSGEVQIFCTSGNPENTGVAIYNLDVVDSVASEIGGYCLTEPTYDIGSYFFNQPSNNYAIIELTQSEACETAELTYEECKAAPEFVDEFLFSIIPFLDSGEVPGGINNSVPEVNVISPPKGATVAGKVPIVYTASDQLGLIGNPISIFYTDTLTNLTSDDTDKTLIAEGLPNTSTYTWDSAGLVESKFYYILVRAVNVIGVMGQAVSGFFNVDLTPPTFVVTASPAVVKEENVVINIQSSEELAEWPTVSVRQRGGKSVKVNIHAKRDSYEGTYKAVSGFDGTAIIEVFGTDLAGNIGTTIVGGGTFNVGVNPPPKPEIISPANNEKVVSSTIDIKGTAREDTEIVAKVNGKEIYKAIPDLKGEFIIKNVLLKKNAKNGVNVVNIVTTDSTGSVSEAVVYNFLYNSAPSIELLKPDPNTILGGTAAISVKSADENGDLVYFRYEIASATASVPIESSWQKIADTPNDTFYFDTTKFVDGNYFLRVVADDGATVTASPLIAVRIRNEASFFIRFYNGLNTIVNQNTATVRGVVYAQKNVSPQPTIKSLEYSIDSGKSWVAVSAKDRSFDSAQESFEVVFKNLKDGVNDIRWRTIDSRGVTIRSEQPIIVDRITPESPEILFPKQDAILTKEHNETPEGGKFVFTIRGKGEPKTIVNVEIDGKKFSAPVSFDGKFRISDVGLDARGIHSLVAFVSDEASNKSPVVKYSFVYNNPPRVVFTNPSNGRGLSSEAVLSWISGDIDGSLVSNDILSYREVGKPFIVLARNLKENKFVWDTTKLSEGNKYELQLVTSDGTTSSATTTSFSIDRTNPVLLSVKVGQSTYGQGHVFTASGQAEDGGSGILFVEYHLVPTNTNVENFDNVLWYKANINKKTSGKKISFSITNKLTLPDGEYDVVVRAVDIAGNTSEEKIQKIIIDGTPPRVGSFEIFNKDIRVLPGPTGWRVIKGEKIYMNFSLEQDTQSASIFVDEKEIILTKNLSTGLWAGEFTFNQIGDIQILLSAVDNLGNKVQDKVLVGLHVDENQVEESVTAPSHWWDFIFRML